MWPSRDGAQATSTWYCWAVPGVLLHPSTLGGLSTFRKAPGVAVVPAQRLLGVLQPEAGGGRQHSRLPHAPAQHLPHPPGLGDKLPAPCQHRTTRGAQALQNRSGVTPAAPPGLGPSLPGVFLAQHLQTRGRLHLVLAPASPGDPSPHKQTLEKQRDTESQCWAI